MRWAASGEQEKRGNKRKKKIDRKMRGGGRRQGRTDNLGRCWWVDMLIGRRGRGRNGVEAEDGVKDSTGVGGCPEEEAGRGEGSWGG